MTKVNWIPEGSHTVTPHLAIKNASAAIDFYKKAFGAKELRRLTWQGDKVMHAAIQIGDSKIYIADEVENCAQSPSTLGGSPVTLHIFIENVDEVFDRAIKAGAKEKMPVTDMFWGDRYGVVIDPFGHIWSLATHKEDLSDEEVMKRQEAFCKQMAGATR